MLARGATRLEMTAAAAAAVVTTATTRHRAAIAISHPRRRLPGGHGGLRRGRRDFGHVRRRRAAAAAASDGGCMSVSVIGASPAAALSALIQVCVICGPSTPERSARMRITRWEKRVDSLM